MLNFPPHLRPGRCIGEGASGLVYEAVDARRAEPVAVKVLREVTPKALARFKREARAFAEAAHENLVDVFCLDQHDGRLFMVMELLGGTDIVQHCRSAPDPSGAQPLLHERARAPAGATATMTLDETMVDAPAESTSMPGVHALDGAEAFARVRHCYYQLLAALTTLHDAGIVHRDVKPSNVLVEQSGRVVVLDLSLALTSTLEQGRGFAGTPAYAAPEQVARGTVDERADVYGAGAMLYETLTGRRPYLAAGETLAFAQAQWAPAPVLAVAPHVPRDLAALCDAMLTRDPLQRPRARQLLTHEAFASVPVRDRTRQNRVRDVVVGREDELGRLEAALERTHDGFSTTVLVTGRAGIGKSTLLRHFLERCGARHPTRVFEGRCYAQENVAFKGVDALVDALVQHTRTRAIDSLSTIPHIEELARIFPSAHAAGAPSPMPAEHDGATARRLQAFDALAELIRLAAQGETLVFYVDDAQWLDDDGFELLRAVFSAPPVPLLLILGIRADDTVATEQVQRLRRTFSAATEMALSSMPETACEALARRVLRLDVDAPMRAKALASASAGDPLLLRELLDAEEKDQDAAPVTFAEALTPRVLRLAPLERRVLEFIVLAGGPIARETLVHAVTRSSQGVSDISAELRSLRILRMARTVYRGSTECLDAYHDRVRDVVSGLVAATDVRSLHVQLAESLDACNPESTGVEGMLVRHWALAGNMERAAAIARRAAAHALHSLAFDRAVELFDLAAGAENRPRDEDVAKALAAAGRGNEAADVWLALAREDPRERSGHLQRAAEQLLTSGDLQRGMEILDEVLRDVGETFPASQTDALLRILREKLLLNVGVVRSVSARERPLLRRKFDALRTVAFGLGMVDNLSAAACHAKAFSLARDLGDPKALGEVLAAEAIFQGSTKTKARLEAQHHVVAARELGQSAKDESVLAWANAAEAVLSAFNSVSGEAIERLERAEDRFHGGMTCARWAKSSLYLVRALSLRLVGDFRRVERVVDAGLADARARRDRYLEVTLLRGGVIRHLVKDATEKARRDLEQARWTPWRRGFHIQHWLELEAECELALYEGRGSAALDLQAPALRAMRRSLLGRLQRVRVLTDGLIGRLLLARARARKLDVVTRLRLAAIVRRLRAEDVDYAAAQATLLEASMHHLAGDARSAQALLERGIAEAERAGLHALAACASLRRAQSAGRGGPKDIRFFAQEEIVRPQRLADVYVSGWRAEDA